MEIIILKRQIYNFDLLTFISLVKSNFYDFIYCLYKFYSKLKTIWLSHFDTNKILNFAKLGRFQKMFTPFLNVGPIRSSFHLIIFNSTYIFHINPQLSCIFDFFVDFSGLHPFFHCFINGRCYHLIKLWSRTHLSISNGTR